MKILFLQIFLFFIGIEAKAQLSMVFVFENTNDSLLFHKTIQPSKNVQDSAKSLEILRGYLKRLQSDGYIETSFDSLIVKDSFLRIKTHIGKRYESAHIHGGNVPLPFLNAVGFHDTYNPNKPFSFVEIRKLEEGILKQAENNGYPFAKIWLDSISIKNERISAALYTDLGDFFNFDSLHIEGFVRIKPSFLEHYLGIKKGTSFNRSKIEQISQRLAGLTFLQERQKTTVAFKEDNTAIAHLLLDPKKASQWDVLVGILPNIALNGSQKFTISFNGKADFQNILGRGERLFANFENLRPQSPRLNVKLNFPYVLNTSFGFDGAFDLYKRDSLYLETHLTLGSQYQLGANNYLKLFWNRYKANNLIINKLQVISNKKLPSTLDVSSQVFGLEWSHQGVDYRFNPRKGFSILGRGGAGLRQVRKNLDILGLKDPNDASFNFSKLYDTLSLNSFQYKIETQLAAYLPVFKRSTVKIGLQTGGLFTSSSVSLNEQYRIGGNKILRGFNEESLFATQYVVGTLEYRLLIGRNSYLYAFSDLSYIADVSRSSRYFHVPMGLGAGITFETKVGLFGLSLAAGRDTQQAFDLRNTKTHFGYISLF